MLVSTKIAHTPSTERLVKLWSERYSINLATHAFADPLLYVELGETASPRGRELTASRLHQGLVHNRCQLAGVQAKTLYEYLPNVLNLNEVRYLTEFTFEVYLKAVKVYQQQASTVASSSERLMAVAGSVPVTPSIWGIPNIEHLAAELEPLILSLQEKHMESKDWRTLGFLTTQFNFANQLLLKALTPPEQLLLTPYFTFIEEQVALPWQRICAAAAPHTLDSPAFMLVEQMFPMAHEVAQQIFYQLRKRLPHHRSRRGGLTDPGITHSCLRDLQMFQAYLFLCILEASQKPIKEELVSLCVMVMQSVEVKWEMTQQWVHLMAEVMMSRAHPEYRSLMQIYTEGLVQTFEALSPRFGAVASV